MTDDARAPSHVFISHSTRDGVVAELCQALSGVGIPVWTDWQRLSPGDDLNENIRRAIDEARHVIAVLSTNAANSKWVAAELDYARSVRDRRGHGFKVVPVLLPGIEPSAPGCLIGDDLVAVRLSTAPGGVQDALPDLLAALGEAEPAGAPAAADGAGEVTVAVAELVVDLSEPAIEEDAGKRRAVARTRLAYRPADGGDEVRSRPFRFTAPWGAIETAELAWYLERYWRWPSGVFRERARQVEAALPRWGEELYRALAAAAASRTSSDCRTGSCRCSSRRRTIRS